MPVVLLSDGIHKNCNYMIAVFKKFSLLQEQRRRIAIQLDKFFIRKMIIVVAMATQKVVPNSEKIRDFTKKQILYLCAKRQKGTCAVNGVGKEGSVSWRRKNMSWANPQVRIEYNILGMMGSRWRNMPGSLTSAKSFACYM